jgi:hypothetical protein
MHFTPIEAESFEVMVDNNRFVLPMARKTAIDVGTLLIVVK